MPNLKVSEQAYPTTRYTEAAAPSTPAAGEVVIYAKADGNLYQKDDAGTETLLANAASGSMATDALWDAKGDLAAGTGANTASKLTVGANDTILMADSGQSTGLKWVASQTPSTQAFGDAAAEGTADTYARGDHKHAMPANPGSGGAMVWLNRFTASGAATLDCTGFTSSTYETYIIDCQNLLPATNNVTIQWRVGTGGTPTYDTGSNYTYARFQLDSASSTGGRSGSAQAQFELGNAVDNTSTGGVSGRLILFAPADGTRHAKYTELSTRLAGGAEISAFGGGRYLSTTAITAVRFFASSGNITGKVDIYGLVHA